MLAILPSRPEIMYHVQTCTCPYRIALIPPLIVVVDIVVAVRKARHNRFVVAAHVVIVTIGPSCPQSQDIQRIGNLVAKRVKRGMNGQDGRMSRCMCVCVCQVQGRKCSPSNRIEG